jgi:methyltransferase (TIGR00027 family)
MRQRASATAQVTALARATVSESIVDTGDTYAHSFLRLPWRAINTLLRAGLVRLPIVRDLLHHVASQTRFFDELVREAIRDGLEQVVILAAGYDTRALRLADPAVRFFEVDHPETQADKRSRLAEMGLAAPVIFVAVDFERDDLAVELVDEEFDTRRPALFLLEGIAEHLAEPHLRATLRAVRHIAAPGSVLALNAVVRSMDRRRDRMLMRVVMALAALLGEPFRLRLDPEELRRLLHEEGWEIEQILDGPTLCSRHLPGTAPIAFWDHYAVAASPC